MPPSVGYLSLVFHSHLPFIRHPEYPHFLEEDWFFEAVIESYAPNLMKWENLRSEGIPFRLTFSLTPALSAMWEDQLLNTRLEGYLSNKIKLLKKEVRKSSSSQIRKCAEFFLEEAQKIHYFIFETYQGKLLESLRSLQQSGHLELIAGPATHGFLPLMSRPSAVRIQIEEAVWDHQRLFGQKPKGMWISECGYFEGLDRILSDCDIQYIFLDTNGVLFGKPAPVYGVYAPVITPKGVNVFARDPESSKQIWSQTEGYPGDPNYREFYRDLGYEGKMEYLKPHLPPGGGRKNMGIKYHRITGPVKMEDKKIYNPKLASRKAQIHAEHFLNAKQVQIQFLQPKMKDPPILVAPYDTELFGHWWYEGPQFLEQLIRIINSVQINKNVQLVSPSDYLNRYFVRQVQTPHPSTWGDQGYNAVWLNPKNSWIYPEQHRCEKRMETISLKLTSSEKASNPLLERAHRQLKRELMLIQSSDWAFIMTTGTSVSYVRKRIKDHLHRFGQLAQQLENREIDGNFLNFLEEVDPILPGIKRRQENGNEWVRVPMKNRALL